MTAIDDVVARTLHVATEDLPWVETAPGFEMRVIHGRPEEGFVATQVRAQPDVQQGWHRHTSLGFGYTTRGAWGHDFNYEYRPGTYIFETPGVVHRFLNGPGITEAFFITHSDTEFIDPETNEVLGRFTLADMVDGYLSRCEQLGLPRPNILT